MGHVYFSQFVASAATPDINQAPGTANRPLARVPPKLRQGRAAGILQCATAVCAPIAVMRDGKTIYLPMSRTKDCLFVPIQDKKCREMRQALLSLTASLDSR
jgi:hypothetical protein